VTAAALNGRGLETFLAVYRASRTTSPGKSSKRPMFPGYVFCRLNVSDRLPVLSCTGVVNIVSFGGQLAVVDETEIAAIEAVQCAGLGAQPWPYLSGGRRVRIEAGPLKGVEGIVNAAKNQFRLVLSVSLLQRSVLVEVERDWIVPLDGSARM
jgi:transcription antitermination factor NusG